MFVNNFEFGLTDWETDEGQRGKEERPAAWHQEARPSLGWPSRAAAAAPLVPGQSCFLLLHHLALRFRASHFNLHFNKKQLGQFFIFKLHFLFIQSIFPRCIFSDRKATSWCCLFKTDGTVKIHSIFWWHHQIPKFTVPTVKREIKITRQFCPTRTTDSCAR